MLGPLTGRPQHMLDLKPALIPGDYLYNFKLPSTQGKPITPNDLVGKPLVMFFYAQGNGQSDGACTRPLGQLRDAYAELEKRGVTVMGLSTEAMEKQQQLADEQKLPFPLLADADGKTCAQYGVLSTEIANGLPALAMTPTLYVIGPD